MPSVQDLWIINLQAKSLTSEMKNAMQLINPLSLFCFDAADMKDKAGIGI